MERIRCPNCGSAAQVKCVWHDRNFYFSEVVADYECGCGCMFSAKFELKVIEKTEE